MNKKPRAIIDDVPVWCVHDALVYIAELKPNPKNPNTHPASQIELLSKIIKEQGWRAPITVSKRSGFIVKGHGRLKAAINAGITQAPVDYQDYDSDASELADMVADNRLSELAEMDQSSLSDIMGELNDFDFNMEMTGFSDASIKEILGDSSANANEGSFESEEEEYKYQILIECESEGHQSKLINKLTQEGLKCRPLIL